ncbi:prenyltransferase [Paenibacillus sp. JTLBN-2024]
MFNVWLFLITLVGAAAAHLFSNMINDLWDYKSGTDTAAKEAVDAVSTNSGFDEPGMERPQVCGHHLGTFCAGCRLRHRAGDLFRHLGVCFRSPRRADRLLLRGASAEVRVPGKGYSEIAILLSFGVLPVMGAYYVQTSHLDLRALLLSLPIGLLTTLILFNHHFLHWQADRQAGKRTLVVVWGEKRALAFSRFLLFLAAVMLVISVIAGALPVYGLLALPAMLPLYQVYGRLKPQNSSHAYLPLMGASVKSAQLSGLIMIVCLVIQGLI